MDKIWKAKWIMDSRFYGLIPRNLFFNLQQISMLPEHIPDLKNVHMLVRKKFTVQKPAKSAYIDITADDCYKLYINGIFVAQGPAPGYFFHYYYNRHDISSYLKEGENTIAVHVYYQGEVNVVWFSGDYRQGLIAELFVNDEFILATDSTWKYCLSSAYSGKTTGYETIYLQNTDSRLLEPGWKNADYDDSRWENACEKSTYDHKLFLQPTPPVDVYEMKPVSVVKKDGYYFIDFGCEISAAFRMNAKGEAGQIVEIRCAEELEEGQDSRIRYKMRCNCNYQEFWTLSGGEDVLEFYEYKGFRYVEVIGSEEVIRPGTFSAIVRHYPFDECKCVFYSSNGLLNKVWDICKNGVKYTSQEIYIDCPTREKGQNVLDTTVVSQSHIYLTGDLRLFRKSLMDYAITTYITPAMTCSSSAGAIQEIADSSLYYPLQLLVYYMHSGDMDFLRDMYPVADKMLGYFNKYKRRDGLLENIHDQQNLVDWPANLRDGYDFDLNPPAGCRPYSGPVEKGCHNVINALYYGCMKVMNEIRDILGIEYENELPALKNSFIKAFFDTNTGLFKDSERSGHSALHSNIFPLLYDILPFSGVKDSIVGFIRKKRLSCGVFIAYFLLKALAGAGEYELLYELLVSTDERSWGNMVREGATTCFEAWGREQKWNTSLCHAWASAPIPILIEDIIGLTPNKPGWKEIKLSAHIPHSLEHIEVEIAVASGRIKVVYKDGRTDIDAPDGVKVITT